MPDPVPTTTAAAAPVSTTAAAAAPFRAVARHIATPMAGSASIAVVGMSCRLPQGGSGSKPQLHAVDTVTAIPYNRWDVVQVAGSVGELQASFGSFVAGAACFDAAAFGLPEAEAVQMDPQQRLLMELAWESLGPALSAAASTSAAGGRVDRTGRAATAAAYRAACGVFVGVSSRDYFTVGKEYAQVRL